MNEGFFCPTCEVGRVLPRKLGGRKAVARPGVTVLLPSSLELPTCNHCLDYSVPEDREAEVAAAVELALLDWQKGFVAEAVGRLCSLHNVTRRRVAAALDVRAEYLSNLTAGNATKTASVTLLRLLRAFVASPQEFVHALRNEALDDFTSTAASSGAKAWTPAPALRAQHTAQDRNFGRRLTPSKDYALCLPASVLETHFDDDAEDAAMSSTVPPAPAAA